MINGFAHIELNTGDVAKSRAFYAKLFHWKITQSSDSMMPYWMVSTGSAESGGGMTQKPEHAPSMWLPYVEVADVKKTLAAAIKSGGHVVQEISDIGEMGVIAIFVDPFGAVLGLWQKAQVATVTTPAKKKTSTKKQAGKKPAPAARRRPKTFVR